MSRGCEQAPCKKIAAAPTVYFCNILRRYEDCSSSQQQFSWFWRFLEEAAVEDRLRVFQWITGLPRCGAGV